MGGPWKNRSNTQKVPETVTDMLQWINMSDKEKAQNGWPSHIEVCNKAAIKKLGWGKDSNTDTLYSFSSIYALGLWAYNSGNCKICNDYQGKSLKTTTIRYKNDGKLVWNKDSYDRHSRRDDNVEFEKLNENPKLQEFAEICFQIGNIVPVWPGANETKGNQNLYYYDLPEIFFAHKKNAYWFNVLRDRLPNTFLDSLLNINGTDASIEYNTKGLDKFLNNTRTPEAYNAYLEHVINVIKDRTEKIKEVLK